MELMDALRQRRAVRDFLPKAVDEESLRALIDAAILAPNSMNRQAWSFTAVSSRAQIDQWAVRAKARALSAFGDDPDHPQLREHLQSEEFHLFHHAPALIVIAATEADEMARMDCCLAAENLMLAAFERGLGTCWIGLALPWLTDPEGKAALFMSERCIPVAPIIIGYPRVIPPASPRHEPHITWMPGPERQS